MPAVLTVTDDVVVGYEIVVTVNEYTVTVEMTEDGSTTKMELEVPYGTPITVSDDGYTLSVGDYGTFEASVAPDTPEYAYSFSGWLCDGEPVPAVLTVTDDVVVGYEIVVTVNEYTVAIVSSDESAGTVTLGSIVAPYGASVSFSGNILTVGDQTSEALVADGGEEYAYAFIGWDVPSRTVTDEMTVVAEFSATLLSFVYNDVRYAVLDASTVSAVGCEGTPVSLGVPDVVYCDDAAFVPVSIGEGAFADCTTVTSISVGSTVSSIGEGAFDSPYLSEILVSEGNEGYSSVAGVLYDKSASVLMKFPASKQRLIIPETVVEIVAGAFQNAGVALKADYSGGAITYFRYVSVPGTVETIGDDAFRGSTLEVLKLADGTTTIGSGAFAGCSALDYVVFNYTLEDVAADAFDGCVFHDANGDVMEFSIEAMAGHKFTGADSSDLNLYVPDVGGSITYGGAVYRIDSNDESKAVQAVALASDNESGALVVPGTFRYLGFDWTVTGIASKAFYGDSSITMVDSAVDVGYKAFANCASLSSVTLSGASELSAYAFANCASLSYVDIDGVTVVGNSAFSGCSSLASVDLGGVQEIGDHAFYKCALTTADLSSATSIGYGAFTGNDLQSVTFSAGLTSVDPSAFYGYLFYDGSAKLDVTAENLAGKAFAGSDGKLYL